MINVFLPSSCQATSFQFHKRLTNHMRNSSPYGSVKNNTALIEAEHLYTRLEDPDLLVFDVRGRFSTPPVGLRDDYDKLHISGARYLDWTKNFLRQDVPPGLASVATFDQALASFRLLGIQTNSEVVVYDDYHHMFAGRIWWAMRYWGFENVSVLNGGWKYWQQLQYPRSSDIPNLQTGNFMPVEQSSLRVSMSDFLDRRNTSCVIDARGSDSYKGSAEDERSGHIPGAINIPYSHLIDESTGCFKHTEALEAVLDSRAPSWRSKALIPSCGSGYSATVLMLALDKLGVQTPLFDDSFAGWKQDANRPVERGAE